MRFQNLQAFDKHIQTSSITSTYIIVCPDLEERLQIMSSVTSILLKRNPSAEAICFSQEKESFAEVIEHLSTRPFFTSHTILQFNETSQQTKKQREILQGFIVKPSPFAFLILGLSSLKEYSSVCTAAKNELVVLDLSQEKPWDRRKRLQAWLIDQALKEGKVLPVSVAQDLLESCGSDILLLQVELLKLISYIGDARQITSDDLKTVGIQYQMPTGWQLADALIWDDRCPIEDVSFSLSELIPLLGQVRYHVQMARQLSALFEQGATQEQITAHLPQLRPAMLEKYQRLVLAYKSDFFDQVIKSLFKIDLLSKNSSLTPSFLWDYLAAQIAQQKIDYANTCQTHSSSERPQ